MSITINGTTGIAGVDGSASTPSVQGADANTGMFFPAADTVAVTTGGTERMRIDSSGNVGIGTSSPAAKFAVTSPANSPSLVLTDATQSTLTIKHETGNLLTYDTAGTAIQRWVLNSTERMRIDTSGNLLFNSGYGSVATAYACRAWVNFNGTGTVAIRASGNVSSITDNGTGYYTVNFTTAMPDANYAAVGAVGNVGSTAATQQRPSVFNYSTTSVQLSSTQGSTASLSDTSEASVAVFR